MTCGQELASGRPQGELCHLEPPGGSGQLGHGSFADELLPHPIQYFKRKGTRVLSVVAGAYHSAAIITSTRMEVATLVSNAVHPVCDDTAPYPRLVPPGAQAAPTHPGAPPEQLGGQQPASGGPKDEDFPLATGR